MEDDLYSHFSGLYSASIQYLVRSNVFIQHGITHSGKVQPTLWQMKKNTLFG